MGFLRLCAGDPLLKTLRETFDATPLYVPESRIRPLSAIAARGDQIAFRGQLGPLLTGNPTLEVTTAESRMATVVGRRSRPVQLELGLKILEGYLKGFGIPPADVAVTLKQVTSLSFSFRDVIRTFVDVNQLGRALTGRTINRKNPAARIYFDQSRYALLVVDSVITSTDFAIHLEETKTRDVTLDLPIIQQVASSAGPGVRVSTTTGRDLIFQGPERLTFAFAAVRFYLEPDGTIAAMPPAVPSRALAAASRTARLAPQRVRYTPDRVLLGDRPGLLQWDA